MTKQQLVDRLAQEGRISKSLARIAVDIVFDSMTEGITKGGGVEIRGFGSFQVRVSTALADRDGGVRTGP